MGLTLIEAAKYENRLEHLAVLRIFSEGELLALGLRQFGGQVSAPHGFKFTGSDELLLIIDRAEVADRWVTTLTVVVTVEPDRQTALQLLG